MLDILHACPPTHHAVYKCTCCSLTTGYWMTLSSSRLRYIHVCHELDVTLAPAALLDMPGVNKVVYAFMYVNNSMRRSAHKPTLLLFTQTDNKSFQGAGLCILCRLPGRQRYLFAPSLVGAHSPARPRHPSILDVMSNFKVDGKRHMVVSRWGIHVRPGCVARRRLGR
jgi:hypothetical protein